MPAERELQFPALAVVQQYVNEYARRMKAFDPDPHAKNTYRLQYALEMAEADKVFFAGLGLKLSQDDEVLTGPVDALFDFRPARIERFRNNIRHYANGCAILCGVASLALPGISPVKPRKDTTWYWIRDSAEYQPFGDEEITGVIGPACWQTYLYAAQGLPVIEILEPDQDRAWLAKWANPYYRQAIRDETLSRQIGQAMKNIEEMVARQVEVERPLARAG